MRMPQAVFLLMMAVSAHAAERQETLPTSRSCTSGESWSWSENIDADTRDDFRAFLSQRMKPVQGFAEGIGLRKRAREPEARVFGEYWITHALYDAGLQHLAYNGFAAIATRPVTPETAGAQLAAIDCLLQLQQKTSSLSLPPGVLGNLAALSGYTRGEAGRQVIWESAGELLRTRLDQNPGSGADLQEMLSALRGSGPHEWLARGLIAARNGEHRGAIRDLTRFLQTPSIPKSIRRYTDSARILLARALYTVGEFDRAGTELKLVNRSSNALADSLSELAWANLLAEKYPEAIGTAMNLEAGGLRHTFTPEAPMVMAMALNELCQYPESVHSIRVFRQNYEKSFKWLSENSFTGLYPLAVSFIKKEPGKALVPDRVASEWVRSPLFIASQGEINRLFEEKDSTVHVGKTGVVEQRRQVQEILTTARDLKPRFKLAKMKLKAGEQLPAPMLKEVAQLKRNVTHLRRLQAAAPTWKLMLTHHQSIAASLESKLLARINEDLTRTSVRMLTQLEEIAENVQLIEVEIYNGASSDIIWQNAHPDYKAIAQKIKDERGKEAHEKVWDWGRAPAGSDDFSEIWEDELGSFKANLYDNCSSKDRYLIIKRKSS